jgi:hypothetical protein
MNQLVKFGAGGRSGQGTRRRTRHLASSRRAWRMEVGRAVSRRDFRGRLHTTSYNVSLDSCISPYNPISTPHGIPSVLVAFLRAGQSSGIPLASRAHAPGLVSIEKTIRQLDVLVEDCEAGLRELASHSETYSCH